MKKISTKTDGKMRFFYTIVLVFQLFACTSPEPGPYLDLLVVPKSDESQSRAVTDAMDRLIVEAKGHSAWEQSIENLIVFMEAEHFNELGVWSLAQERWMQVITHEDGRLAELALKKWYEANIKENGSAQPANHRLMARLLLAQTEGDGSEKGFLAHRRLLNEEDLSNYFESLSGRMKEATLLDKSSESFSPPLYSKRYLQDDPLLSQAADDYCSSQDEQGWKLWRKSLPKYLSEYWLGLIAFCQDDFDAAIKHLEAALEPLQKARHSEGIAVYAAEKLISAYRGKGDREGAARTYKVLTLAYEKPELAPDKVNRSGFDLIYDKINQTLWSARYQALVGDYATAKKDVQKAFVYLDKELQTVLSRSQRFKLRALKAEAFHILAHRISYELEDFDGAISYALLGLEESRDMQTWYARFLWYAGWYQFRLERYPESTYYWQRLLRSKQADNYRSQLLYWMAKSLHYMNQTEKRDDYSNQLCEENPLSYYVVVALAKESWIPEKCSEKVKLDIKNLTKVPVFERASNEVTKLRSDPSIAPYLYRAELAIKAEIGELKTLIVRDLYDRVRKRYRLKGHESDYVYLGQLLHAAGLHFYAISLAYELSIVQPDIWERYPSQIHVYFPRPHLDLIQFNAGRFELKPELVLSIGRQESSFRPKVKSHAGAIGLLQLIPPTAKRYAAKLGIDYEEQSIEDILGIPEYNIALGSAYLSDLRRRYKDQTQLYVAAYNAGEYAVDAWFERRYHEDPLIWIEGIPFSETKKYVKLVSRNLAIYEQIVSNADANVLLSRD